MTMPSSNARRGYALALLVVALFSMSIFAVWPHIQANRLSDKLSDIRGNLAGSAIVMAERFDLASRNNLPARTNQKSVFLLLGTTTGTAGAYLQKLVLKHVAQSRGVVSQVHVLPAITKNDLMAIPISLNLTTNTKGLRDIIFDLETNEPLLFIQDLVIRPVSNEQSFPDQATSKKGRLSLLVSMKIIGYMRKGGRL